MSEIASSLLARLNHWEDNYDNHESIIWAKNHADIPVFAIALYLGFIFYVPGLLKKPWRLRTTWAYWNLLLSVFSIIGASRCVPHLFHVLQTKGFEYSVCAEPESYYLHGRAGTWVSMFIFSKIPELMDTVFLVLQKKPVIFLHWFHHVTVLLYCWHSFTNYTATGLWFTAMNFSVHSVMYTYYFFSISGLEAVARLLVTPVLSKSMHGARPRQTEMLRESELESFQTPSRQAVGWTPAPQTPLRVSAAVRRGVSGCG